VQGREKLLETLIEARQRDARIVFDNNYRPRLWASIEDARAAYRSVLPYVDLALLTVDDEQALFDFSDCEAVFAAYEQIGTPEVVLKRGAEACLIRCDGASFEVPAQVVERVVDTTAAGDSFSAAYLASRLKGGSPVEAAEAGHRLASRVIQVPGALIPRT
jgi:2-dehydro-3-deoxygluconokinase